MRKNCAIPNLVHFPRTDQVQRLFHLRPGGRSTAFIWQFGHLEIWEFGLILLLATVGTP